MTPTLLASLLSTSALLLSIAALYAHFRTSDRSLHKRLNVLSERVSDLEQALEAHGTRIRSIRAQVNAATANRKASRDDPEPSSETIEEAKDRWTRDTNVAIARNLFRNPLAK